MDCREAEAAAAERKKPARSREGWEDVTPPQLPGPGCEGPLVHATGKGWVKEHKGQYYDALHVKNGIVKICLVESRGGIAPPTKRIIFNFAKEVGSPSAVDRTDYGTASGSAQGFAQHHSQQLSRAAVCGDAQNINNAARNMREREILENQHRALIHDRSQCPTPLRAGLLGPRVVSPHPQGLQGSHLNLSQTSAQRHPRVAGSAFPRGLRSEGGCRGCRV